MTWLLLVGLLTGLLGTIPVAHAETPQSIFLASSNSFPGSFTRNLYKGCTGTDVRTLQRLLKDLCYYTGAVDGIFGSNTRTAVENFQRRNGLSVDGIAGRNTMRVLLSGEAIGPSGSGGSGGSGGSHLPAGRSYLQFGDENQQVLAMQAQLQVLGYYSGPLTGYFGSQTLTAVRNFQSRNNISVDGLAGRITLGLMFSGNAIPASGHVKPTPTPTASVTWRVMRYGMIGTDVAQAQQRLYALGYYTGKIHGEFTSEMRTAVMAFQARNWLTVDGIIGQLTYVRMFSANAVPAESKPSPTPTPTGIIITPAPSPTPTPWGVIITPSPTLTPTGGGTIITNTSTPTPTGGGIIITNTSTPPPQPSICVYCKKTIVNSSDHALADCGVAGHYKCTNTKPDVHLASTQCSGCGLYACEGSGSHTPLGCGHMSCVSGDHGLADCEVAEHYKCKVANPALHTDDAICPACKQHACKGGDHKQLDCDHYTCEVDNYAKLGCGHNVCESCTHELACGKHYLCQVSNAELDKHRVPMPCKKHYECSVTKPDLHQTDPCGY